MTLFYYLANFIFIAGLSYWLWRQQKLNPIKQYFWPALLLKLLSGILLGLYYDTYFAGGDARLFQSQADLVTEYARVSPGSYLRLLFTRKYESETLRTSILYFWYSNSYFMVMVLSALNLLTNGHYFLNGLYLSLFSFWGLWQLSSTLVSLNHTFKMPALVAFLFFPSVVFWSAGVGKEAIYLGSLAWLVSAVLQLLYHKKGKEWLPVLAVLVSGYILWKIKFYFAALVFALLFGYAGVKIFTRRYTWLSPTRASLYFIGLVCLASAVLLIKEKEVINIPNFFFQLKSSYNTLSERSLGKPMLSFPDLEPTWLSLLRHGPSAVIQAILRPYPGEGNNLFYYLAGAENLLVMVLLIITGVNLSRKFKLPVDIAIWATLMYIVITAALIGLFTPNIGSLSRYKTVFMPFLVFMLLLLNHSYLVRSIKK